MRAKFLIIELTWILGVLLAIILLGILIFGEQVLFGDLVDIQLHDTYYVFSYWTMIIPIYMVLALFIFFIKEGIHKFNRILPNLILSLFLTGTILLVALLIWNISYLQGGWVMYPPLDTEPTPEPKINATVVSINTTLIAIELLLGVGLLLLGIKSGKLIKRQKHIG